MDDARSAARRSRRRGTLWLRGKKPRGFFLGRRWVFVVLGLLVAALTVTLIAVFSGDAKERENEGVVALSDFLRICVQGREAQMQGTFGELGRRLFSEPFEITVQAQLKTEALEQFPLDSVPVAAELKYDGHDMGLRIDALGFNLWNAYLIDGSVVTETGGKAQLVARLPGDEQTGAAQLPFLDTDVPLRVLDILAACVPADCTQTREARAYSPMAGHSVPMTEVKTTLDAAQLAQTAAVFSERLRDDAALFDDAQGLLNDFAHCFGLARVELETLLARLEDGEFPDTALAWSVYQNGGVPMGVVLSLDTDGTAYELTALAEFDGRVSRERIVLTVDGAAVLQLDTRLTLTDDTGALSVNAALANAAIMLEGTLDCVRYTDDAYGVTGKLDAPAIPYNGETVSAACTLDMRVDLGKELGLLAESRGWQDIYERSWKDAREPRAADE